MRAPVRSPHREPVHCHHHLPAVYDRQGVGSRRGPRVGRFACLVVGAVPVKKQTCPLSAAPQGDLGHGSPRVRPLRSLPVRLLILTVSVAIIVGLLVQAPEFSRDRRVLLGEKVLQAYTAALSASAAARGPVLAQRDELLHASGIESIRLIDSQGTTLVLAGDPTLQPTLKYDLRTETPFQAMLRGLAAAFATKDTLVQVTDDNPFKPGSRIQFVIHRMKITRELRTLDGSDGLVTLGIASAVGGLVYVALLILLVRPLRRLTTSISAFRADPEHGIPLEPEALSPLQDDEISVAARELAAMQRELRAALWRNSRLAALGTVVAKVSHDVRSILTPALLNADRLQQHADPAVQRAGEIIAQAVERVTDLVHRTLDFAREGPPPPTLTQLRLHRLINEAAESARALVATFQVDNEVPLDQQVEADRDHLYRVLVNLLRNAAEAGAHRVRARVYELEEALAIELADDGPGLPQSVRANLFRPFANTSRRGGTGLGLAIARDLMLAHGGDIVLVSTGTNGAVFRLMLPLPEAVERVPQAADTA